MEKQATQLPIFDLVDKYRINMRQLCQRAGLVYDRVRVQKSRNAVSPEMESALAVALDRMVTELVNSLTEHYGSAIYAQEMEEAGMVPGQDMEPEPAEAEA